MTLTNNTFGGEAEARGWIQGKMLGEEFKTSSTHNYLQELCWEAGQKSVVVNGKGGRAIKRLS